MRRRWWIVVVWAALASLASPARADDEARSQVLFLGTWHFHNPGLDVVKSDVADVLAPEKQREIARVVDALAAFRPTKVAIEARPERAQHYMALYDAYRAGEHELDRNEIQQIGFRMADRFDLERLHAIDQPGEFPFEAVMAWAAEHDPAFVERTEALIRHIGDEQSRLQRKHTIGELLRLENDPAHVAWSHAFYMDSSRVGAGGNFIGAQLLTDWYEHNIRIFAALQSIAEPGDRVLVLFGAGHAAILKSLIEADPRLELVDTLQYLPAAARPAEFARHPAATDQSRTEP